MSPDDWLVQADEQLLAGDTDGAVLSALKVLDLGQKRSNPAWIGGSLTVLCKAAVQEGDRSALRIFTDELEALIDATGDQQWAPIVAEMKTTLATM